MRFIVLFLFLLGLVADIAAQPFWVKNPPPTTEFYIGIGFAPKKKGTDYQKVAIDNALEKMAQNIGVSVSVQQTSVATEINGVANEEFEAMTSLSSSAELSRYETVDSWENKKEFWIFLRISHEDYRKFQLERLNQLASSSKDFFIGVGQANKKEFQYLKLANDRALANLSQSISVNINASQLMESVETSNQSGVDFKESFSSAILTETSAEIEGYEQFGIWEDDVAFFAFYRLERSAYEAKEKEKRSSALTKARTLLATADNARAVNDISTALLNYLQAINSLGRFVAENHPLSERDDKDLVLYLIENIREIWTSTEISVQPVTTSVTTFTDLTIPLEATLTYSGNPIANMPVGFEFIRGQGELTETSTTNSTGVATSTLQKVSKIGVNAIVVSLSISSLLGSEQSATVAPLLQTFSPRASEITIDAKATQYYISSKEIVEGGEQDYSYIAPAIKTALSKKGLSFVDSKEDAQYIIEISSNVNKASEVYGMFSASATSTASIKKISTNEVIYSCNVNDIKGSGLDVRGASTKALQLIGDKIAKQIEKEFLK